MRLTRRAAAAACVLACLAFAASAAGNWPEKPIKLIVPFPPGGGGDNMARLVMNRVAQELGQPLVVENLAGAGGNIPAAEAYRLGAVCELLWKALPLGGEPPMTRFLAEQLSTAHWYDMAPATRDFGYRPRVGFDEGLARLKRSLDAKATLT